MTHTALKVLSIIDSCINEAQLETAKRLIDLFEKKTQQPAYRLRAWVEIKQAEIQLLKSL